MRQAGEHVPANLGVSEVTPAEYGCTHLLRARNRRALRLDYLIGHNGMDDQAGQELGVEKG